MIDKLQQFFENLVSGADEAGELDDQSIHLAAAALMLEVARSDNSKQSVELAAIEDILLHQFGLEESLVHELIAAAGENVESAHDLYQFTQVINAGFGAELKLGLVRSMWTVAFADGHVDAIEDHIIRRVAGLLHVAHGDFIRMKLEARDSAINTPGQ